MESMKMKITPMPDEYSGWKNYPGMIVRSQEQMRQVLAAICDAGNHGAAIEFEEEDDDEL